MGNCLFIAASLKIFLSAFQLIEEKIPDFLLQKKRTFVFLMIRGFLNTKKVSRFCEESEIFCGD